MRTVAFLCFTFLYFRYTLCSCPSDSLEITSVEDVYEFLWNKSRDIVIETLKVNFLQEMQTGSLDAERYISFTLQDINYILMVTQMLKYMSAKVIQPVDLREFIIDRYLSYKKYAVIMCQKYSFENEPTIRPTPAMEKYLSSYRKLADDPLYFAVGLVPCARLWVWLANTLEIPKNNAYYNWKVENKDGHPEKHYKALLNKHLDTPEKVQKATNIFREQMQNEHDFFESS